MCQKMIDLIESENEDIIDPKNRVTIPDKIRSIIAKGINRYFQTRRVSFKFRLLDWMIVQNKGR